MRRQPWTYSEILTHGKQVVSSTAVAVPDITYQGANFNPDTTTTAGLTSFKNRHNRRTFVRFKNTHATDTVRYGFHGSAPNALTTTNGFSLAAGGILDLELPANQDVFFIRGAALDITVEFLELGN